MKQPHTVTTEASQLMAKAINWELAQQKPRKNNYEEFFWTIMYGGRWTAKTTNKNTNIQYIAGSESNQQIIQICIEASANTD